MSKYDEILAETERVCQQVEELKKRLEAARPVDLEKQLSEASARAKELQKLAEETRDAEIRDRRIKHLRGLSVEDLLQKADCTLFKTYVDCQDGCDTFNVVDDDNHSACVCIARYAGVTEIYAQMRSTPDALKRTTVERLATTLKTWRDSAFDVCDDASWLIDDEYNRVLAEFKQVDPDQEKAVFKVECNANVLARKIHAYRHTWPNFKRVGSRPKEGEIVITKVKLY